VEAKVLEVWNRLGLPVDFRIPTTSSPIGPPGPIRGRTKVPRVSLQELVDSGLVRDGQILYFHHTRLFPDERAEIFASANKLRYKIDGKIYSVSDLAKVLLIKHGFKRDEHGVAGPRYWMTKDRKLLNDLNEQIRAKRGDRR
jgi:hypothetical protein